MKDTTANGFAVQKASTLFNETQSFDNLGFENFDSFASAKNFFSAGTFVMKSGNLELLFAINKDQDFSDVIDFFFKEIADKVKSRNTSVKFIFFVSNFEINFSFAAFNEFFNEFLNSGSKIEFTFIPSFPFDFENNEFMFSVRQTSFR